MTHALTMSPTLPLSAVSNAAPTWLRELWSPLSAWAARLARQNRVASADPTDFAQEAVCRMMATYGPEKLSETPPPVLRAIAYRALRNMLVDESRRTARAPVRDNLPEPIDIAPLVDERLGAHQDAARLQAALATLRADERAFVLAVMELDSVPAAQKLTGWPAASPYYHLRLILGRLRDHMERTESTRAD